MQMMGFRDMQYRHSFDSYSWLRNDSSLSSVWVSGFPSKDSASTEMFCPRCKAMSVRCGLIKLCRPFSVSFPLEQATVSRNRHSFSVGI
jgi:hypothetical protein